MLNDVALLISSFGTLIVVITAFRALKGTVLDPTNLRQNPWPLLWYLQVALVLIPLLVISFLSIDNIQVLYLAQPGTESYVAVITMLTLLLYILSLGFFLRFFGLSYTKCFSKSPLPDDFTVYKRANDLSFTILLFGLFLVISFYFLGYKHAFITSIVTDTSLLQVRLANKYNSHVPSQIASMLFVVGYILAMLSGYLGRYNMKKSLLYLMVSIFLLTAPGDKAPLVEAVILWAFAQGKLLPKHVFSPKIFKISLVTIVSTIGLICFALSLQARELSLILFGRYLLNRLGVGQMAGMYETFGLVESGLFPEGDYFWHMIPFASLFIDYVDYQKALMMISENVGFAQMGVKNTYFVAEAYAIGGPLLMWLSPIVVGFVTALGMYILIRLSRIFFGRELSVLIATPLYLLTHNITGGFSGFPFLKGIILLLLQMTIIWAFRMFISGILNPKQYKAAQKAA